MAQTEIDKIIAFVSDQREHVKTDRQWKRRLANFGFTITDGDAGKMIAVLPKGRPICPLPNGLCA